MVRVEVERGRRTGMAEQALGVVDRHAIGDEPGRVDLAWAETQARNDMEAILHLQQVDQRAPEVVRYNTIAREMLRELLKRSRSRTPALDVLARRAGVLT
jgi:hypothetical protein